MKFSINCSELQNAIAVVYKGISGRSTLPVLSGILLDARRDTLVLQTTDLELAIEFSVPAFVEEEGEIVVPGKLFSEIVKTLPDAALSFESRVHQASITCGTASFTINVLNAEDFPAFPKVDIRQQISIPFSEFQAMVRRVVKMVSKDESRPVLTGVLITFEDDLLRMVATDSYRLALTETRVNDIVDGFSVVIAGGFLSDLAALRNSDQDIVLGVADNQIIVTYLDMVFINRRLEGMFPNYKQLLSEIYTTRATVEVDQLIAAVKRAALFGSSTSPLKFDINNDSQTLLLSAAMHDIGSASETLTAMVEGEDVLIAFNSLYILDGLSVVSTEKVHIDVRSPQLPGIFRSEESENYLYLVMPVRVP